MFALCIAQITFGTFGKEQSVGLESEAQLGTVPLPQPTALSRLIFAER